MRRKTLAASVIQSAGLWMLAILCLIGLGGCNNDPSPPGGTEGGTETGTETGTEPGTETGTEPAGLPAVRLKLQDFVQDPARLASLVKAVEVMKSRNSASPDSPEYRRSWEYWAAMHGFYGTQAKAGLIQDAINSVPANRRQFFQGLRDMQFPAQPAGLASQVWDKCTHFDIQFTTWHRMYLFFFERILQEAAADPTLRLPYWDYTDPAQLQLPAQFAQATLSDGRPNPLFDNRRRSQTVTLSSQSTDIDDLLQQPTFEDFSGELEQQPHGYVHCTVGPGCPIPLLGDVPVAANDPIFWLHHANIDRIFECWRQAGGPVPDDAGFLDQEYTFIDTTGSPVKMKVRDLFDPNGPIDYTYDHATNCSRVPPPPPLPTAGGPGPDTVTPLTRLQGVAIDDALESVRLDVPETGAAADLLLNSLEAPTGPARTELVLEKISVTGPPGVLFDVYLTIAGANAQRQYVGTLSFFGVGHGKGHAAHGEIPVRKFDVTDELQALKGASERLPDVQVVFEASLGVAGSTVEAARPLFNRQANLKVGTIQLRVKGEPE